MTLEQQIQEAQTKLFDQNGNIIPEKLNMFIADVAKVYFNVAGEQISAFTDPEKVIEMSDNFYLTIMEDIIQEQKDNEHYGSQVY